MPVVQSYGMQYRSLSSINGIIHLWKKKNAYREDILEEVEVVLALTSIY